MLTPYGVPISMCATLSLAIMPCNHAALHVANISTDPTAYIPVPVRRSFDNPLTLQNHFPPLPPPAPVMKAAQPKPKIVWPASVRSYVQRSFDIANLLPDVSRSEMELKLKHTISAATENNTLATSDWDNMPLPQHLIRAEKAQATTRASPPTPWQSDFATINIAEKGVGSPSKTSNSKKRKSYEVSGASDLDLNAAAPWRTTNTRNGLEDRVTHTSPAIVDRLDQRQQRFQEDVQNSKSQKNMDKRQRRFDAKGGYKSTYRRSPTPEASSGPVVGRCPTLEKQYFRLTAAPNPDHVRPLAILKQTLELLKKKWKKESDYNYICNQFKSLRQDLTVQRIKNDFTVTVYEIHARIALEKGDLGEYNQCQTQLRALYSQNLGGHPVEFKAYRILYFIHTGNRTALNDVLADLTTAEKEERAIKHALGVRSALALGNYHRFFRLYLDTPNMGAYLMDMFVVRERLAAMSNICKAYVTHPRAGLWTMLTPL